MRSSEPDAEGSDGRVADGSGLDFGGLTEFLTAPVEVCGGDLAPGARLGDVTIVRLLAEGGMGRVYEGLQGMPCRSVAVKVIRPGVLTPEAVKRFRYEAHILGRLTHPGIARIYTVGMQPMGGSAVPYFVMEFVEDASSITAYASRRGLSSRDRVALFRDACKAVAHGHQKGVIHRDLKPGNILVDGAGHPKVIDFGIARTMDGDLPLTTLHTDVGKLVGTLQYMCPEQFEGMTHDLDVRADVYALGVVLFELLTGQSPYDITSRAVYEVARIVKEVEPRSLSATNPRLRGDLNTIVAKCMEKDREQRYSSAAELEADLGRYLRGEPIVASPPRLLGTVVRLARRHRVVAAATVGVLLAGVLALAGISVFAIHSERMRVQAEASREEATRQAAVATLEREAARREGSRADLEAGHAKQRLYVANTRSLQASLAARSLRMARQLYAENAAIIGRPLPIEMHCLGAQCDDALAVLDLQIGPVERVEYSPDGRLLMAMPSERFASPDAGADGNSVVVNLVQKTEGVRARARLRYRFFTVGDHGWIDSVPADDKVDLQEAWITRIRQSLGIGSWDVGPGVSLADSPDGRRQAMHMSDGRFVIVEKSTGDVVSVLAGERVQVTAVALNRRGSRVATHHVDGSLTLWDAESGSLLARCVGKGATAMSFGFSPEGSRLAVVVRTGERSQRLMVYDADVGTTLSTLTKDRPLGGGSSETLLVFSPDGRRVVTTADESDLLVHTVGDPAAVTTLRGHNAAIVAVAFSPDGRQLASGTVDGHIRLWNTDSFSSERELMGHDGAVRSLAFCPDGETIASGGEDGTVRVWSRTATEPLGVLPGVRGMTAVAYRGDGRQLAVAGEGMDRIELWDPLTVERLHTLDGTSGPVEQIAYSPDGTLVAAASADAVRVWRSDSGELASTLQGHTHGAVAVTFSPDGGRLLATARDMTATVWDPRTGTRLVDAPGYQSFTNINKNGAVFGLHGERVAHDGAQIFDTQTGNVTARVQKRGRISCLAASPDGLVVASGMPIGTVYLDDFEDGRPLTRIVAHQGSVRAMAFSADGTRLVTGSMDTTAGLWDARSGQLIQRFKGHEGAVEAVLFSPDGGRIITAATDGTVRIWDAAAGNELCVLPGQRGFPRAVALSHDGTRLVTAASDGPVRIWGLSNADVVRSRQFSSAPPQALTAQP